MSKKGDFMSETADRVTKIVVEHLGVDADKVTVESSFIDDLGADSLDKKNSASKFLTMRRKKLRPSRTQLPLSTRTRADLGGPLWGRCSSVLKWLPGVGLGSHFVFGGRYAACRRYGVGSGYAIGR
jgi:hypothetical protein